MVLTGCLFLAFGATSLLAPDTRAGQTSEVKFAFPMVCTINVDCFSANYMDEQPGPGIRDYNCGPITYSSHQGWDITLPNFRIMDRGVPILAAADGRVVQVRDGQFDRNTRAAGAPANFIWIEHSDGTQTRYLHLKKGSIQVKVGEMVSKGQEIALTGSSGNSTDAHLHFEVRLANGIAVDPFEGRCGSRVSRWEDQLPYENEFQLLDFGMTNFIASIDQLKERPATRTDFTLSDPVLFFWVQVKSVNANDVARVEWYTPDGKLFRSDEVTHNGFLRYSWWSWSERITSDMPQGQWMVKYFINSALIVSLAFHLSAPTSQPTAEIWLAETQFNFGPVKIGSSRTYNLIIENLGNADLVISSIASSHLGFQVEPSSVTVPPRQSQFVAITFAPSATGEQQGQLSILTNDRDESQLTVSLTGLGKE